MSRAQLDIVATGRSRCDHSGLHSPVGRYDRASGEIRYVTVCDACGAETGEVTRQRYVPDFDPRGNDPFIGGAL